jgi:hypothetical protein
MRREPVSTSTHEPIYRTLTGELVTVADLHGRTQKQVWFPGTFIEWCARKRFIADATPVAYGIHTVDASSRMSASLRRNLDIARDLYGDEGAQG